jgi:hypothetical protein
MITPYEHRQTIQELYRLFSKDPYVPKASHVLRTSKFELNPLYQQVKVPYTNDIILEVKPFILSGPEYN